MTITIFKREQSVKLALLRITFVDVWLSYFPRNLGFVFLVSFFIGKCFWPQWSLKYFWPQEDKLFTYLFTRRAATKQNKTKQIN